MDKSQVLTLEEVDLREPVFVDLTSYPGSPVHVVGRALVERARARKVGELYSPYFPDSIVSNNSGLCQLPRLELHASVSVAPNLLVLTGEQHADPNDVFAYYDVAEAVLNHGVQKGCRTFASCSVFRSRRAEEQVYVAATNSKEASLLAERLGCKPFGLGRVISPMGPLLGLASTRGFRVICVLGSLKGGPQDEALPSILLDRLVKALELTLA